MLLLSAFAGGVYYGRWSLQHGMDERMRLEFEIHDRMQPMDYPTGPSPER